MKGEVYISISSCKPEGHIYLFRGDTSMWCNMQISFFVSISFPSNLPIGILLAYIPSFKVDGVMGN